MELQLSSATNILAAAKLKTNELTSALAIGTRCGSTFTLSEDARLSEKLAAAAGVHLQEIPPWLQRLHFAHYTSTWRVHETHP